MICDVTPNRAKLGEGKGQFGGFSHFSRDYPADMQILTVVIVYFSSAAGHSLDSASSTAPTTKAVWPNAKLESERSKNNRRPSATQNSPRKGSALLQV